MAPVLPPCFNPQECRSVHVFLVTCHPATWRGGLGPSAGGDRACVRTRSPCEMFTLMSSMARPVTRVPGCPRGSALSVMQRGAADRGLPFPVRPVSTQLCLRDVSSQVMSDEAGPVWSGAPGAAWTLSFGGWRPTGRSVFLGKSRSSRLH